MLCVPFKNYPLCAKFCNTYIEKHHRFRRHNGQLSSRLNAFGSKVIGATDTRTENSFNKTEATKIEKVLNLEKNCFTIWTGFRKTS